MSSLKDKVVLITGASSGFGEDAALRFAEEGCRVVLAARRVDRLQNLAAKIQDAGGEAIAIPMDIADAADIKNMVESAIDLYGRIDILFNNAGMGKVEWFAKQDSVRDINTLVQVNLVGLMQVTREVLPYMLQRGEGHIINMVSVAGLISTPLISTYAASKFGVKGFTDALRREVTPLGIDVSAIYPGPAATEFGQHVGKNEAYGKIKSFLGTRLTSDYVASRVVDVAKRPRRSLIIPWWFRLVVWFDMFFPIFADWIAYNFSEKNYKPD